MCRNKSSRNDPKLHGTSILKIRKILEEKSTSGGPHPVHEGGGAPAPLGAPLPRGPLDAPPTSTWTPYIHFWGEKNQGEGFIAFYDTEPPPSPKLSRNLESARGSGEGNPLPSSSSTILHHQFHDAHRHAIVDLLDGDGLDEIYHVIELVLLGFDP